MTTTKSFAYTGSVQQFVVPASVTSITVRANGGASWSGGTQGRGGRIVGDLAVQPGQVLYLYIGGRGGTPVSGSVFGAGGGFNGGGRGGHATGPGLNGGGGGGATDIRIGGKALSNRVCVAGGGGSNGRGVGSGFGGDGGASTGHAGGIGGTTGAAGGGTQAAGGAAGTGSAVGTAGTFGNGGHGGDTTGASANSGGGGGGGYYGGGGGAGMAAPTGAGGGGGGSNFVGGLTNVTENVQGYVNATGPGAITLVYNQAPNLPILGNPASGGSADIAQAISFTWTFSDPDAGDVQSAADFRYGVAGSAIWTTVPNASTTSSHVYVLPANTLTAGTQYEWQVQTYDSSGTPSGWSNSNILNAVAIGTTATITAPTVATTITTDPQLVTWTTPGTQYAYQIRIVADAAGLADTSIIYTDTGPVFSSLQNALLPLGTTPLGGTVHLQVRYQANPGVWSAYADTGAVLVNVNAPGVPTLVLTPSTATGSISVAITNPSTPNVTSYNQIWRTDDMGNVVLIKNMVDPNTTYVDNTPASGVSYRYQVKAFSLSGGYTWST